MLYFLIPLVAGLLLLFPFLFFRVKEKRIIAVIIKGFISLLFIITAIVCWQTSKNPNSCFPIFILIGLFFGLLGDVFLDIKYISIAKADMYTILGFISFAIGHLFYILGLFLYFFNFNMSVLYLIIPIIVTLLFVGATLLMEKISSIRYMKMKPFVVMYGVFLFFVLSIYVSAAIQGKFQVNTLTVMSVALILFVISDLILNNTYFSPGFTTPAFIVSNHVIYYFAQFLIAVSLFFLM